jgi:PAS domain S-box-containing protein
MNKLFQLRSLNTRITLWALIIFLVSVWSLTWYSERALRQDMERFSGEQQFSTVSFMASEVNDNLIERIDALHKISNLISEYLEGDQTKLQEHFEQFVLFHELFNGGTFITDSNAIAIASLPLAAKRAGLNYADRDYIMSVLKEGHWVISDLIMGKQVKAPIFAMAVPIRSKQGKIIGVLTGITNLGAPSFLDKLTQNHYGQAGGYLLISPKQRLIITATDKRLVMKRQPEPGANPLVDKFVAGYEGTGITNNTLGEPVLASAKGIRLSGWYIALTLPVAEAFAPIDVMTMRLLYASLLVTLVASAIIWWILRDQLKPFRQVAQQLSLVSAQEQDFKPLAVSRDDELGAVISGFNSVLHALDQREIVLENYAEKLKQEVSLHEQAELDRSGLSERLRLATRAGGIGIWVFELSSNSLEWDEQMFRLYGIHPQNRSNASEAWAAALHQDDKKYIDKRIKAALESGEEFDAEFRIIWPDQSLHYISSHGVVQRNVLGKAVRMIGTNWDITASKKVQERLLLSDAALKVVSQGVVITFPDQSVLSVNSAFTVISAYREAEIIGRSISVLFGALSNAEVIRCINQAYQNAIAYTGELLCYNKNGNLFWNEISLSPVFDEYDNLSHFVMVCRDISERKKIEVELRTSKERLSLAFEANGDGVWDFDVASNTVLRSRRWKEMLGYAEADLDQQASNWTSLIHPEDLASVLADIEAHIAGHTSNFFNEHRVMRKDRSYCWIQDRGMVVRRDVGGKAIRMVGTQTDISARKEVEKMKATFISTVSHELRTPITSICGSLGLLDAGVLGELPVKAQQMVKVAHKNSTRLITLVNDILDMEKLLSGKMLMHLEILDIETLLRQAIDMNNVCAELHQVRFVLDLQIEKRYAFADANRLTQVITNLLSNAVKFSHQNSDVVIRLIQNEACLRVEVEDYGVGIPVDFQAHVFDAFTQADSSDTRQQGSTGLGLHISKRLIEAMRGKIGFTSEVGKGTRFWFDVPMNP